MLPRSKCLSVMAILLVQACSSTPAPLPVNPNPSQQPATVAPPQSPPHETPGAEEPANPQPTATPTAQAVAVPLELAGIRLSAPNRFLQGAGQNVQLKTELLNAQRQPVAAEVPLEWFSSRPQDLSIDDQGLVKALVDQGYSVIRVRVKGTELEAELIINISSPQTFSGGGGGGGSASVPRPLQISELKASSQTVQGTGSVIRLDASALMGDTRLDGSHFSWRCLQEHCNLFTPSTGATVFWQAPNAAGQYQLELTVSSGGRQVSQAITIQVNTGPGQILVNPFPD